MERMKKILIAGAMTLLMLCPAKAQIAWQQVEPGVWKGVVGTPEEYSLLGVAGVTTQKEGFARLPEVALPDWRMKLWVPYRMVKQVSAFLCNARNSCTALG